MASSSSSQPAPRDKLPTVVHNTSEETAAGPQDITVTKADFIPTKLTHYAVSRKLGQGGMGWVLLAEDTKLNRKVALKVMRGRFAADKESRERFKREAKAAAQLRHDNIITIYQVDEDRNIPFFAMELLEGGTLQQRLEYPKPLSIGAAVRIAREIAQGLQAAHERGVIHRDIKPANIWLESPKGRVKILDFGLAHQADAKSGLTQAGEIVGTPHYMAPEQARGRAIDARSDLFSLGCILYRMTTGKLPFAGESLLATLTAIAVDTPTPVCQLNPNVPHALADVIERLLAKDPAARPSSAAELIEQLIEIERDLAPGNRSGSSIEIPPAILVQTRLPVVAPPSPAQPTSAPRTSASPVAAPTPRRLATKAPRRPLTAGKQTRWSWFVAVGSLAVLGPLLVVGFLWLARDLLPSPPEPGVAKPGAAKAGNPSPDLRSVEPLQSSLLASKVVAEWALAKGGPAASVQVHISAQDAAVKISSGQELPSEAYQLEGIEFRGSRTLADADLGRLAGINTLHWLDLNDTQIGDSGIVQLDSFTTLTTLKLEGTQISDLGLAQIVQRCPMLKRLHIGRTACSAAAIESLTALKQLEELSLLDLPVTDAGLKQVGRLAGLQVLDLSGSQITDQGLTELAGLSGLTSLALDRTSIGDRGLTMISKWGQLASLKLNGCQITDAGLAHLAVLPRLESLEIKDNEQLRDAGLTKLGRARSLVRLVVTNGQFSQEARDRLQERLQERSLQCEIKLVDASGLAPR